MLTLCYFFNLLIIIVMCEFLFSTQYAAKKPLLATRAVLPRRCKGKRRSICAFFLLRRVWACLWRRVAAHGSVKGCRVRPRRGTDGRFCVGRAWQACGFSVTLSPFSQAAQIATRWDRWRSILLWKQVIFPLTRKASKEVKSSGD